MKIILLRIRFIDVEFLFDLTLSDNRGRMLRWDKSIVHRVKRFRRGYTCVSYFDDYSMYVALTNESTFIMFFTEPQLQLVS